MRAPGHGRLVRIAVEGPVVQALGLEQYDRIVVLDGADQQSLGVVGVRGHRDLEAAHVREQHLGALRVRLAAADAAAAGHAHRDRRVEIPGAAIAQPRELADDLVVGRIDVVGELHLGHGPQTVHAHADRRADDAALGDRRVEHAMLAVLALQSVGAAEHAAEEAHVLAEHDDVGIAPHGDVHGGVQRLDHVHLRHGCRLSRCSRPVRRAAARAGAAGARAAP